MLRPVKEPDYSVTDASDSMLRSHAGETTVVSPLAIESATSSVVVPFSLSAPFNGIFSVRVLVDTSVVEVYAQAGRAIETIQCLLQSILREAVTPAVFIN